MERLKYAKRKIIPSPSHRSELPKSIYEGQSITPKIIQLEHKARNNSVSNIHKKRFSKQERFERIKSPVRNSEIMRKEIENKYVAEIRALKMENERLSKAVAELQAQTDKNLLLVARQDLAAATHDVQYTIRSINLAIGTLRESIDICFPHHSKDSKANVIESLTFDLNQRLRNVLNRYRVNIKPIPKPEIASQEVFEKTATFSNNLEFFSPSSTSKPEAIHSTDYL